MGGEPRTALNVVCFPQRDVPVEILGDILRGGMEGAHEAGAVVVLAATRSSTRRSSSAWR